MEYKFKIQLKGISNPPVWRQVIVPADFTFLRFHNVIQTVFDWEDYHLFEFRNREYQANIRIGLPTEGHLDLNFGEELQDASTVKLSEIFKNRTRKFIYVYDFGDDWVHEITLQGTTDDKRMTAFCLSGEGCCPPEDCGGPYAYEHMKKILETMPDSEEANEYKEWLGLDDDFQWDAYFFNPVLTNSYLKDIF